MEGANPHWDLVNTTWSYFMKSKVDDIHVTGESAFRLEMK